MISTNWFECSHLELKIRKPSTNFLRQVSKNFPPVLYTYSWSIGHILENEFFCLGHLGCAAAQGLIESLGSMVIFDENQGVSDVSKYELY